jgi:glycosyltransferase involved in cell wall biosynthesis
VAYFEILKTYISANGLENCVSFVGHIAGEFKYELLRTSRCLIFTSVLEEAQPLVIIEANSQSTPVIAYDVGAISDLIEEGANGYLASKGDVDEVVLKYLKLIEDEALFSRIRSKSLATFLEVYSERRYTRDWTSHLLESMNDNYS